MERVIVVNFKTYPSATGESAVTLAKTCEKVSRETGITIIAGVQAADLHRVSGAVSIPVYAQHVDGMEPGRNTGYTLPETVKANGAAGVFLNHSEHPIARKELETAVTRARASKLKVLIFTPTPHASAEAAALHPDYIAVEPPELVAGDVSISTAKPELITLSAEKIKASGIPLLCGAGVKNAEDVKKAVELGAVGIAVASGITKSAEPEKILRAFATSLL